jgi:hypothetical protein
LAGTDLGPEELGGVTIDGQSTATPSESPSPAAR